MACCDINEQINKDFNAEKETYEKLLATVEKFKRGDMVYCLKSDKDGIHIKFGKINSLSYNKSEVVMSIRRCELNSNTDFQASTKNFSFFSTIEELTEAVNECLDPQANL